jgi:predicted phosphate transport protein (TIGR00153 family)
LSEYVQTVERSRPTGFQLKIILLAGAGVFLDGYDLFIISIALILLKSYFTMNNAEISALSSAALIGAVVGSVYFGNIADKLGRKKLFVLDMVFFVVFAIASALARNLVELILFRFLLGIGIGADYPISSSYVAEFVGAERRGRAIASVFAFQGVGVLCAIGVGLSLLSMGPNAWRLMLLSGIFPAIVVLVFRTRLPETLRWYVSKGKMEEAKAVVQTITGKTVGQADMETFSQKTSFKELLSSPYKTRLFFASISWFLVDIAVYGIGILTPTFIRQIYGPSSPPTSNELVYAVLYTFAGVGYLVAVTTIDRVGRKTLQIAGFAVMGLALLFAALLGGSLTLPALATLLAVFYIAENAGPNTTTWVYPVELFPTRIRGTGHGFAATMGKVGAVVGVFLLPLLLSLGKSFMLGFVALAAFVGAGVSAYYGIETKKQSLEDVSEIFKSFYEFIARMSSNVVKAASQLRELMTDFEGVNEKYKSIKDTEHTGDELVHEVFTRINRAYLAPIEQAEISALTKSIDDVVDIIHAVAVRVKLYKLDEPTQEMKKFVDYIVSSVDLIDKAVKQLPNLRGENSIMSMCIRINELENLADTQLNESVAKLFDGHDPIEIIKLKEIYEYLELVTDKCEDVADVLRDLVVKYS